jgi:hypothetical protein
VGAGMNVTFYAELWTCSLRVGGAERRMDRFWSMPDRVAISWGGHYQEPHGYDRSMSWRNSGEWSSL